MLRLQTNFQFQCHSCTNPSLDLFALVRLHFTRFALRLYLIWYFEKLPFDIIPFEKLPNDFQSLCENNSHTLKSVKRSKKGGDGGVRWSISGKATGGAVGVRWGRQKCRWIFFGKIGKFLWWTDISFENSKKFRKLGKYLQKIPKISKIFQEIRKLRKFFWNFEKFFWKIPKSREKCRFILKLEKNLKIFDNFLKYSENSENVLEDSENFKKFLKISTNFFENSGKKFRFFTRNRCENNRPKLKNVKKNSENRQIIFAFYSKFVWK